MIPFRKLAPALALVFVSAAGAAAFEIKPAAAFEIKPYDKPAFDVAMARGKPVLVEIYASWCPICQAQHDALNAVKDEPAYKDFSVFAVDFEAQKPVVKMLNVPRSTLILYKDGKEVARESWGATMEDVSRLLMKAGGR